MFLIGPTIAAVTVVELGYRATYYLIALSFALTVAVSPIVFSQYRGVVSRARPLSLQVLSAPLGQLLRDGQLARACLSEFFLQSINNYYGVFIVVLAVHTKGLGAPAASALVSTQGLTYVGALFLAGGLTARLGPQVSTSLGSVIVAAGLLALGLFPGIASFYIGGAALGLGLGVLQTVNLTNFARIGARVGRGTVAGLNALSGPAGALFGSLCGGLLTQHLGIRTVFLLFIPVLVLMARNASSLRVAAPQNA